MVAQHCECYGLFAFLKLFFVTYWFWVCSLMVKQSYTLHNTPHDISSTPTSTKHNYYDVIDYISYALLTFLWLFYNYQLNCSLFKMYWFRERGDGGEGEQEISICCSTYVCTHWLILVWALTGDQIRNLGVSGRCSNQLLPSQG